MRRRVSRRKVSTRQHQQVLKSRFWLCTHSQLGRGALHLRLPGRQRKHLAAFIPSLDFRKSKGTIPTRRWLFLLPKDTKISRGASYVKCNSSSRCQACHQSPESSRCLAKNWYFCKTYKRLCFFHHCTEKSNNPVQRGSVVTASFPQEI